MANLTIRNATKRDALAIALIHVAGWRAAYRDLMPPAAIEAQTVDQRRGFWKGVLSSPGAGKVAVVDYEKAVIAFCSYGPTRDADDADAAEIYALYVEPSRWRQGWGRALCEHAAREAALREHRALSLWVLKENNPARKFYELVGYRADGAERTGTKLTGTPFVEIRYRRKIA